MRDQRSGIFEVIDEPWSEPRSGSSRQFEFQNIERASAAPTDDSRSGHDGGRSVAGHPDDGRKHRGKLAHAGAIVAATLALWLVLSIDRPTGGAPGRPALTDSDRACDAKLDRTVQGSQRSPADTRRLRTQARASGYRAHRPIVRPPSERPQIGRAKGGADAVGTRDRELAGEFGFER